MKPNENITVQNEPTTSNYKKIDSNVKIIDSNVPIEDMLGSVTTNNIEGSQQLRTSARVFKKMRLDTLNIVETKNIEVKKEPPIKEDIKQETKKFRPLWTQEDKDLFFEALNEYGKDFEAIHNYITTKLRKKNISDSQIKSRDQVRHLYYRSFHKISKHLKFSDEIKKPVQELYALINYGELRRKMGVVQEKTTLKLNEMIYTGSVAVRIKGKNVRIRTPMCKALRKLNQLDEKHEDLKLPTRVTIELKPKNMHTYVKVQEMAQNPRVRIVLPLQKRLSSVIKYMSERWKSKVAQEFDKATLNPIANDCFPPEKLQESCMELSPFLRLSPPSNCQISLPSFNLSEYLTSQSICLNAYEERIGVKIPGQELFKISFTSTNNSKKSQKRPRNESTSEKTVKQPELSQDVDGVIDGVVNNLIALQNLASSSSEDRKEKEKKNELQEVKNENEDAELKIERVKKGWTIQDSENVSVGDLYLMFGSDSKLVLEYSWNEQSKLKRENLGINNLESMSFNQDEDEISSSLECEKAPLSTILKRLLSIAKLHYRKNIVKCPCGHVCGSSGSIVSTPKSSSTKVCREDSVDSNKASSSSENYIGSQQPVLYQSQVNSAPYFRRPTSPNSTLHAQLASIRRLKPKYCNRRGRFRRAQQVVVERKLPLLANKQDISGSGRIVQMNIIPQNTSSLRQIAPKKIDITSNITSGEVNQTLVNTEYVNGTVSIVNLSGQVGLERYSVVPVQEPINVNLSNTDGAMLISDNATTPSRVSSPTSISNLLDMALNPNTNNDILMENVMGTNKCEISFAGLLQGNNTPPSSPSRILKENDNQWLNSEVGDFSLSSLLGHLESPMKATHSSHLQQEDSRMGLTQDVDQHLQSLLTETSLDYTAKFADLAAQVVENLKK